MKNTSTVKELNTSGTGKNRFKYQSFKERVKNVKIDAVKRERKEYEPEVSYFHSALESWRELNLTLHFTAFMREIRSISRTLPQILYHKDEIINILKKHLRVRDSLAYEPLLDLTTKLAHDLEEDFYPYFGEIIECVIELTKYRDVEILEWTFNCITYLFKYLSKQLENDLCFTYRLFAPLLGESTSQRPYIRQFAAEAFAYLLRKAKDDKLGEVVRYALQPLRDNPSSKDNVEGLSIFFVEAVKDDENSIHDRGTIIIRKLLESLYDELSLCINEIGNKCENFGVILDLYVGEIERELKAVNETNDNKEQRNIIFTKLGINVSLLHICTTVRKGSRIKDFKRLLSTIIDVATTAFDSFQYHRFLVDQVLNISVALLTLLDLEHILNGGRELLDKIFQIEDTDAVLSFSLNLANVGWDNYTQFMLPHVIKYSATHWKSNPKVAIFLSHLLHTKAIIIPTGTISPLITKAGLIQFASYPGIKDSESLTDNLLKILSSSRNWVSEVQRLGLVDIGKHVDDFPQPSLVASAINLLSHVEIPFSAVASCLTSVIRSLLDCLNESKSSLASPFLNQPFTRGSFYVLLEYLLGLSIEAFAVACKKHSDSLDEAVDNLADIIIDEILFKYGSNEVILRGTAAYLNLLRSSGRRADKFTTDNLQEIYHRLSQNINSFGCNRRLYTLKILGLYDQFHLKPTPGSSRNNYTEPCDVFAIAISAEETEASVSQIREKTMKLRTLGTLIASRRLPDFYIDAVIRLCLGQLTVNFVPLWNETIKVLTIAAEIDKNTFWTLLYNELSKFNDESNFAENNFSNKVLSIFFNSTETSSHWMKPSIFHCPNLKKYNEASALSRRFIGNEFNKYAALHLVSLCSPRDERHDYWNYHGLVIRTLTEVPEIAEQRSRQLIPLFFRFAESKYEKIAEDDLGLRTRETDDDIQEAVNPLQQESKVSLMEIDSDADVVVLEQSAHVSRNAMLQFLRLFAKFKNPQSLYKSAQLRELYLRLLAKGDTTLQSVALDCLFTWKSKLTLYKENLNNLVDDNRFRDELSTFSLAKDSSSIEFMHRPEIMPIVIRILYGRAIARRSKAAKGGLRAKRTAALAALSNCLESELKLLVDLLLEPFEEIRKQPGIVGSEFSFADVEFSSAIPYRKQVGFLKLLEDLLRLLGTYLVFSMHDIFKVVLYIARDSHKLLERIDTNNLDANDDTDSVKTITDSVNEETDNLRGLRQQYKTLRQLAIKRIADFFKIRVSFNYNPYIAALYKELISPRILKLGIESTQAPSPLMKLIYVWASRKEYLPFLVDFDPRVLPAIFSCLSAKKVRDSVFSAVLDIIENILKVCKDESNLKIGDQDESLSLVNKILIPNVPPLLDNLEQVLLQSSSKKSFGKNTFSRREISILAQVSGYVHEGDQAAKIVELLIPYLHKPAQLIPELVKLDILRIFQSFIRIIPGFSVETDLFRRYYKLVSTLFTALRLRESRMVLQDIFSIFAELKPSLCTVAKLIAEMNAFSIIRLDEPDYEVRLGAFNKINTELYKGLTPEEWLPILYNCLFYIQDPEELSIRNNSSFCITQFIRCCAAADTSDVRGDMELLVKQVIYPGIKSGVRLPLELVRQEYISILDQCVRNLASMPQFADLVPLLANNDEEANFFNNIYHLQNHRRARALKRFSNECNIGAFSTTSLTQIFLPLIRHFILAAKEKSDPVVMSEVIGAIETIARHLPWGKYYNLVLHYLKLVSKEKRLEKLLVKVIIAILDGFHFDVSKANITSENSLSDAIETSTKVMNKHDMSSTDKDGLGYGGDNIREQNQLVHEKDKEVVEIDDDGYDKEEDEKDEDEEGKEDGKEEESEDFASDDNEYEENEEMGEEIEEREKINQGKQCVSPDEAERMIATKIHDKIIKRVVPDLNEYLVQGTEETIAIRVPIAFAIAKLLKALPERSLQVQLPSLLTKICHILKSRAQDTRDITRDTLSKINNFLGPKFFDYILKELQAALTRGYQLHVLGYTLHSLLATIVPTISVGDLDYCLQLISEIMINDIFGSVGEEKDAEEIPAKIKEMKTNKSFDSFELITKVIDFRNVGILLVPLKEIMSETISLKVLHKVDEVLRKMSVGLNANPKFEVNESAIFCRGLISQNLELIQDKPKSKVAKTLMEENYAVQLKRDNAIHSHDDFYSVNAHRFVKFGLSLLLTALKHEKFDTHSEEQLALLNSFVDIVGNAMFSKHPSINILAVRVLSVLCKLRLPALNNAFPVIVKQTFSLIKGTGSTGSELCQACFKLLTVLIRHCKDVEIKEHQLAYLIDTIRPDLEEPEKQGVTFSLIKAIISRKFIAPEIYDLMQEVSEIMITNQSAFVRDLCRQVVFQFLLDYPQGRGRLKTFMALLAKNLNYIYESGRQSVMEMLNLIFVKFPQNILMEYTEMYFLALVMSLVNDESSKCREMSGALIKRLLLRMDGERNKIIYSLLDKWFVSTEKKSLQRTAAQVYGLIVEAYGEKFKPRVTDLTAQLESLMKTSLEIMQDADRIEADDDNMALDVDWEICYYALNTYSKLLKAFPETVYAQYSTNLWILIEEHLLYPHAWIRLSAARLLGVYFSGLNPETIIISGTQNNFLTRATLKEIAIRTTVQLKSVYLNEELGTQIVKNLFFVGKCFFYMKPEEDLNETEQNGTLEPSEDFSQDNSLERSKSTEPLSWLLMRLSHQLRLIKVTNPAHALYRTCIFKWFAAMANFLPVSVLLSYLETIISPIYRFVNDETNKGKETDEIKRLGYEVLDLIQKRVGVTEYHNVYNKIRQQVAEIRRERKKKRVIQSIVNPEAAAKRKVQKNEMKKKSRKRKNAEFARMKTRYSVTKKRRTE